MPTNLLEIKKHLQSETQTYERGTRLTIRTGKTITRKRIANVNIGKVKHIRVFEDVLNYSSGGYTPIHWLIFECFVDGEDEKKGFRMKTTGNHFDTVYEKMLDKIALFIREAHAITPTA